MKTRERLASKHPNTTHGLSGSVEYGIWSAIKSRCLNKNHHAYSRYGGRGITVCKQWADSFENFLKDVGRRPSPLHTIERIKNSNGYNPKNIRWATRKEQGRNTRANKLITINGEAKCVSEWCERFNISQQLVSNRVNCLGWDYLKALTTTTDERLNKLTVHRKTKSMIEWSKISGVPIGTLWARIKKLGWTPEQAIYIKPKLGRNQHA
jgi:hypothetical protein